MCLSSNVNQHNDTTVVVGTISSLHSRKEELYSYLSSDERQRAERMKSSVYAERFKLIRGYLRFLLSTVLALPPNQIHFTYGKYGKPIVENNDYFFNVSHAKDYFLIGLHETAVLGVDIECPRPFPPKVHPFFFHQDEINLLASVDPDQKMRLWLSLWTRKEALGKAVGEGLSSNIGKQSVLSDTIHYNGREYVLLTQHDPSYVKTICLEGKSVQ
ncbi:4'-phosphopantetheinyl transferase superfamily protein [Halalkalibacterium halodurans]|uniref:Siderophore (Surfactin) biosynthesis regulatory protein n=3 Tax=Halalkalibacterium halodurans TaxID=86665 RepID=Q9KBS3_HALH5|nr:4'-phosphopantetheinyl transferase superfamily protein [Halalkalibacterium halodurans]MED4171795.1 4'-phosphopantetheinyl transferase superfamily protein [Halalkalibacterium halodurans]BAB05571.1 siderophore (surfactin) biosynthesis regulatory protein [Halalkalibacterium halodurans C-125]